MEALGTLEQALANIYPLRVPIALGTIALGIAVLVTAYRRGWHRIALAHRRASLGAAIAVLLVAGPMGYYLASPIFTSSRVVEALPASAAATGTGANAAATAASGMPVIQRGEFRGADAFHFGQGRALIVQVEPGRHVLRFEDFAVRNGPDLFVYLSTNPNGYAPDAINLGHLRATEGALNYDIPPDTDLSRIKSAVIWCRQFSVLFATASLSA